MDNLLNNLNKTVIFIKIVVLNKNCFIKLGAFPAFIKIKQ